MKLGFHYHVPAGIKDGKIYVPGDFGVFIDSLAKEVDELVCFLHSPLEKEWSSLNFQLTGENIILKDIGPHFSMPYRLLMKKKIIDPLRNEISTLDAMLLRAPSPLSPFFVSILGKETKFAMLLVGNYVTSDDDPSLPFWKNKLIRWFSYYIHHFQNKAAGSSLLFVNSQLLYAENKKYNPGLIAVKTSTLDEHSFFQRIDTITGEGPIILLYTGRLILSKGLLLIVEAIAPLIKQGFALEFHLAGGEPFGENSVTNEIIEHAKKHGIADALVFHGMKKIGEELNSIYRMADIFITASTGSEGFPRTIWEAMANSLPVIATRVGSIPFYLKDQEDAILIEPKKIAEIREAVLCLINNKPLRIKLIKNGFELAKSNTLEIQSKILVKNIEAYCLQS